MTSANDQPQRLRPRFSLLTLVLVMTVIAMAVAIWRLNRELAAQRAIEQRLRDELGNLAIRDRSLVYAVRANAPNAFYHFRWRIYMPDQQKGQISFACDDIPATGLPAQRLHSVELMSGEHSVDFVISRRESGAGWEFKCYGPSAGAVCPIGTPAWLPRGSGVVQVSGVEFDQVTSDLAEPLILWRERYANEAGDGGDLAPGFVIWLEAVL